MAKSTGTYLYAVMPEPVAPKAFRAPAIGTGSAKVRVVREDDLAAVVSDAVLSEYDPTRDNLTAHERVVDEALHRGEMLPVRFGTVAGNDSDIKRFLREKHDELQRSFDRLRGRAEVGLKVYWDVDQIFAEILAQHEEIRALRDVLVGRSDSETYDQRLELGRTVSEVYEATRRAEGHRIVEQLGAIATDVAVNRLLAESMVLNAAFLVEQKSLDDFDAAVNALGEEERGRLTFKYVGPIAPYDFVNIVVPRAKAA